MDILMYMVFDCKTACSLVSTDAGHIKNLLALGVLVQLVNFANMSMHF